MSFFLSGLCVRLLAMCFVRVVYCSREGLIRQEERRVEGEGRQIPARKSKVEAEVSVASARRGGMYDDERGK